MVESVTRIKRLLDIFFNKGVVKNQMEVWKLERRKHARDCLRTGLALSCRIHDISNYKSGPHTHSCLLFTTTIIKCLLLLQY